jgi:hypothetical protein
MNQCCYESLIQWAPLNGITVSIGSPFVLTWSRSRLSISTLAESRLDSRDFLDSLKNDILTNLDSFYAIKSQFVSIETLDLDISKTASGLSRKFWLSRKSRHFKTVSLDAKDILDLKLNWSRLSRPPCLDDSLRDQLVNIIKLNQIYQSQISIIYLMCVPSSFSYCYHSANETISAVAQSDPIKRRLLYWNFFWPK